MRWPSGLERWLGLATGRVIFSPINASGMGRFQLFDLVGLMIRVLVRVCIWDLQLGIFSRLGLGLVLTN